MRRHATIWDLMIDVLVERHKIPQGGVKFNAMYGSRGSSEGEGNLDETFVLYEFKRWSGPGDGKLISKSIRKVS